MFCVKLNTDLILVESAAWLCNYINIVLHPIMAFNTVHVCYFWISQLYGYFPILIQLHI